MADRDSTWSDGGYNREAHFGNKSNERGTPRDLVRQLKNAIGGMFDLDPCSGAEPIPLASTRYIGPDGTLSHPSRTFEHGHDNAVDGLSEPWFGTILLNPPYDDMADWLGKMWEEIQAPDGADLVVGVVPARTSTKSWWHEYVVDADYVCFVEGRLEFEAEDIDQGASFPSAVPVWAADDIEVPDDLLGVLNHWGEVYQTADDIPDSGGEQVGFDSFTDASSSVVDARTRSVTVPSTTGGETTLADACAGDKYIVEFDERRLNFPSDLPGELGVTALTAKEGPAEGEETYFTELLAVGATPEAAGREETYVMFEIPHEKPADIRAFVTEAQTDLETRVWSEVRVASLEQVRSGHMDAKHVVA